MLNFKVNGRLCSDPAMGEYGDPAKPMATVRIASSHPGVDEADFFTVAVFGEKGLAEISKARKGDTVKLTGNGRQNVWESDDGGRHQSIALRATSVEVTPRQRSTSTAVEHVAEQSATASASV